MGFPNNRLRPWTDEYGEVLYMCFYFILSEFFEFETQGYSTPKWLAFAKRCSNHHIAFDNLLKFMESVWMEMVYAFRISNQTQ